MTRTLLLAVVALALLVGCEDPRALPQETSSVTGPRVSTMVPLWTPTVGAGSPSTPTVTSTPAPVLTRTAVVRKAWPTPPRVGVDYVDAVIAAIISGDSNTVERYVTGSLEPCGMPPVGTIECAPGISPGTRIKTIGGGAGCEGQKLRLEPVVTDRELSITPGNVSAALIARSKFLVQVAEYPTGSPYRPPAQYRLVFGDSVAATRGMSVTLDDAGIVDVFGWFSPSCADPLPGGPVGPLPYNIIVAPPP